MLFCCFRESDLAIRCAGYFSEPERRESPGRCIQSRWRSCLDEEILDASRRGVSRAKWFSGHVLPEILFHWWKPALLVEIRSWEKERGL